MSKVEFVYGRGGKKVLMARRYAETLRKLGHGTYADAGYQTRMLSASRDPLSVVAEVILEEARESRASAAILEFAKENGVDIDKVVGTGKDGRIKKSDIEALIDAQDLA